MNILYYDKGTDLEILYETCMTLRDHGIDVIVIPNSMSLMVEASAESLFSIGEQIYGALVIIKEERPEEYEEAHKKQIAVIRDKQWKEALNKNKKEEKI